MKNWKNLIIDLISYAYIALFFYAAVSKITDYEVFEVQVSQSPLLSNFAGLIIWFIPGIEIIISVALFFKKTLIIGLYATLALMSIFTAYIVVILNFSKTIPCSCGGILSKMGWTEHLIFNLFFIAIAILAIILSSKKQ